MAILLREFMDRNGHGDFWPGWGSCDKCYHYRYRVNNYDYNDVGVWTHYKVCKPCNWSLEQCRKG